MTDAVVLLPVYQPDERLVELVAELRTAAPHTAVVVVDDGSGPNSARLLRRVGDLGCAVRRMDRHRGKGSALKEGCRYVLRAHPGKDVVCADADGQHRAADILRLAERVRDTRAIVLGVRRFDGDVPLRSRIGNAVTRTLFKVTTGVTASDTQTGLRAYPHELVRWLLTIPGERFDYEMAVLVAAARHRCPIEQVTVPTRYLDGNASSHFGVLVDSVRTYRPLLVPAETPGPDAPCAGR
ncbi:glycosyltransferase family 2 protein [Micromonospora sp. CPCC 205561]|uniref:glycosyltransferase family 2 protein n=1 Tax=Micromonospora sp. CPCC 205561 TaxID=3122407 RepID=UPI002FEF0B42